MKKLDFGNLLARLTGAGAAAPPPGGFRRLVHVQGNDGTLLRTLVVRGVRTGGRVVVVDMPDKRDAKRSHYYSALWGAR